MLKKLVQEVIVAVLIVSLIFAGCTQGNVQINNIIYDSDITFLDLSGKERYIRVELSNEDIKQLGKLRKLKVLDLSNNDIDDLEGIEKLSNLEEINLSNTYIRYYTIDALCKLENLKKANFTNSTIGSNYNQIKRLYDKFPSADITPSLEDALYDNMNRFNADAKLCYTMAASYLTKCPEDLPSGIYTGELTYIGENIDKKNYDYIPKSGSDGLNEWLCLWLAYGLNHEKEKDYGYYSIIVKDNAIVSAFYSDKKDLLNETEPLKLLACTSDHIVGGYPETGVIDWIAESKKGE